MATEPIKFTADNCRGTASMLRKGLMLGEVLDDAVRLLELSADMLEAAGKAQREAAPGFDAFWFAYPRKEGKAAAVKQWRKLSPDAVVRAKIADALGWQRDLEAWRNGIVPHAETYLRGRRWEDEAPVNPGQRADLVVPFVRELCEAAGIKNHSIVEWFGRAHAAANDGEIVLTLQEHVEYIKRNYGVALADAAQRKWRRILTVRIA